MSNFGVSVPKRELIQLIIRNLPEEEIKKQLHLKSQTDISRRLDDFPKNRLVGLLISIEDGRTALEAAKASYPFKSNPTLYLISVNNWPNFERIFELTTELAKQSRNESINFGTDGSIRSVFIDSHSNVYKSPITFQEVPVIYEKKVEYTCADPESENYGELITVYSLEKAIIWYSSNFRHAILLCGDFQAVKPILYFCNLKLQISWQLPYLTEEMLNRLSEGARPRKISFTSFDEISESNIDAQSITISDQSLENLRSFRSLTNDPARQKTFGFYSNHPDLGFGGIGISRQYGRIWTPTRLRKDSLLALSIGLIERTEQELVNQAESNPRGFISYYQNIPIKIGISKINSQLRNLFEEIIYSIMMARRSSTLEFQLNFNLVNDIIDEYKKLDIFPSLQIHCENCGDSLILCSICNTPLSPFIDDGEISFQCPSHPDEQIYHDDSSYTCSCGENIDITFSTDIRLVPGVKLLRAIHGFTQNMENNYFDGSFIIIGSVMKLLLRSRAQSNEYQLADFLKWNSRAHINHRTISEHNREKYKTILGRIKEKCSRNNGHPTRETCRECLEENLTTTRITNGIDLCLPRLFGYAIDENYDGIHHGHEVADIKYSDSIITSGQEVNLGIHLKSRISHRYRGLGRSVYSIKGLYTQYCHSAYLSSNANVNLNVIGISVPNSINDDVRNDFQFISHQLGYPLIILDEEDWIKILEVVFEKTEFE